jgi:tagatose 1,6-diphosphate aldolase
MAQPAPVSVTRLMGLNLTPGKLRGLQRISNPNGTLTMVATDQNSSMINMIKDALKKKGEDRDPTYEEIVEAKVMLSRALSPHCSALLVDAYYGYWSTIASFAIPAETGLLIRVEQSGGPKNSLGAPLGGFEPGWSVEKVKRCGADAVKLLAFFEPGELNSAEHQFQFVKQVYEECQRHDILMLLEPLAFPYGGEDKKGKPYLDRKAKSVIETARYLGQYCDVYKAEFPGTMGHESESQLRDNLKALDQACPKPWVLLSAGVEYDEYKTQVEMAMDAGASGILGGRAFWKEYFTYTSPQERQQFAETTCTERVRQIHQIVNSRGKPWFQRYGLDMEQLHQMRAAEKWHFRYTGAAASGGPAKIDKDSVY